MTSKVPIQLPVSGIPFEEILDTVIAFSQKDDITPDDLNNLMRITSALIIAISIIDPEINASSASKVGKNLTEIRKILRAMEKLQRKEYDINPNIYTRSIKLSEQLNQLGHPVVTAPEKAHIQIQENKKKTTTELVKEEDIRNPIVIQEPIVTKNKRLAEKLMRSGHPVRFIG